MDKVLYTKLVTIRRKIHANPEIGYREKETADLVCKHLDELGIPYRRNIAKTGVVAVLKKGEGKCIALRADMDALPIKEENNLPFRSTKTSVTADGLEAPMMHACGHD